MAESPLKGAGRSRRGFGAKMQPTWAWVSAAEAGVAGFTAGQRNGGSDDGKGGAEGARSEE